jgi:hypothetical protein
MKESLKLVEPKKNDKKSSDDKKEEPKSTA